MITQSNDYCNDYCFRSNGKVIITLGGGSDGKSNHYFFTESNANFNYFFHYYARQAHVHARQAHVQ
jgi:hypothetical protein